MNEQKIPGGTYSTQGAMNFELCEQGELYMICQGAGGGYGDVLDRDPQMVIKDIEEELLSPETAREIYKVAFDSSNLVLDLEETETLREEERQARIKRGIPYDEFVKDWVRDEPAEGLPYMGSWGDDDSTLVVSGPGMQRTRIEAGSTGITLMNPKDLRISALEQEVAELKAKLSAE
jgi:hypothetical protein